MTAALSSTAIGQSGSDEACCTPGQPQIPRLMFIKPTEARILERQKMSQVLFRRLSVDFALVLPFKDSIEAAEPRCSTPIAIKLPDTPRRSEAPPR
jgi:hypothetical protein